MKKVVRVVYEKEIEVEIDDKLLTEEAVAEFSAGMWPTDVEGLFKHAALCAFHKDDFVEGLGEMRAPFEQAYWYAPVKYSIMFADEEAEIMEDVS